MYHVSCIKSNNRGEKEEIRWIVDEKIEEENEEIEEKNRLESRFIEHHYCRLTIGAGTSPRRPKASAYRAEAECCFRKSSFFLGTGASVVSYPSYRREMSEVFKKKHTQKRQFRCI